MLCIDLLQSLDNVLGSRRADLGVVDGDGSLEAPSQLGSTTNTRHDLGGKGVVLVRKKDRLDGGHAGDVAFDDGQLRIDSSLTDFLGKEHIGELGGIASQCADMDSSVQGVNQSGVCASASGAKESDES